MFKLLKSQKADLDTLLKENGFNPTDFEIGPSSSNASSHDRGEAVRLKGSDYYFGIYHKEATDTGMPERFIVDFSPGKETIQGSEICYTWELVRYAFVTYLSFLEREMTTVDPWESAKKFSNDVQALPDATVPNTPVTEAEREEIQKGLDDIKAILLKHVADSDQKQKYIEEQFRILRDGITNFGKKDYLMLLCNTVIGVATTIGLRPDIWSQIVGILNGLLFHIPRLLA